MKKTQKQRLLDLLSEAAHRVPQKRYVLAPEGDRYLEIIEPLEIEEEIIPAHKMQQEVMF